MAPSVSATSMERTMPPLSADERTTLESWLDFYRVTLASKCEGLVDERLRLASVPPSNLTLLGLVQQPATPSWLDAGAPSITSSMGPVPSRPALARQG
jgi:hypothetical protein